MSEGELKKRIRELALDIWDTKDHTKEAQVAVVAFSLSCKDFLDEARKDFYDLLRAFPTIKPEIEPVIKKWFGLEEKR